MCLSFLADALLLLSRFAQVTVPRILDLEVFGVYSSARLHHSHQLSMRSLWISQVAHRVTLGLVTAELSIA